MTEFSSPSNRVAGENCLDRPATGGTLEVMFKLMLMLWLEDRAVVKTVTMLEFRRDAEKIIDQVRKGQRMLLTYRGETGDADSEPMQEPACEMATTPSMPWEKSADRSATR